MVDHDGVQTLYHYCSPNVFLSIIKHDAAWLTALSQSNDHLEGDWIVRHWLDQFEREASHQRRAAWEAVSFIKNSLTALGMCFSEERDLLSQWRGYAMDGAGFSIHFDRSALEEIASDQHKNNGINLVKVKYGASDCQDTVTKITGNLTKAFKDDYSNVRPTDRTLSFNSTPETRAVKEPVIKSLYTVKSRAFKEEREWRLLMVEPTYSINGLEYREARGAISPYLPLKKIRHAITGVTLGPTNKTPQHVIMAFLGRHGIDSSNVRISNASYRTS